MVTITFPDRETEKRALGFLLGRFSGRVLGTGEHIVWSVELAAGSVVGRDVVTVNGFRRGTIISVGLHPLRNGFPGGGRGESGLFKCPRDTPPPPGKHCDSVTSSTSHGKGVLPKPTGRAPMPTPR